MHHEIVKDFSFEAAHRLPEVDADHPCRNIHGHTYQVSIHVAGSLHPRMGWLIDFHDLESRVSPVLARLDHRLLNEVEGLENPTAERIAAWIWHRLEPHLPGLAQVVVHENPTSRALVRRI